ncbi:phage terminase, large subunit [Geomicrobium sp. JCM 19037]|nr:phage terminase, large subunit [Geomicrobium sp. JCM 19037]
MGVPFIAKPTRNNVYKAALFTLGVDSGKETVINRLKVDHEGSPGYCHFPVNEETGYDASYFEGITAEKRVVKYYKGRPKVEWQKKSSVPNEPLDLRNYATAALEILNPDLEKMKENDQSGAVFKQTRKRGRRRMSKGVR